MFPNLQEGCYDYDSRWPDGPSSNIFCYANQNKISHYAWGNGSQLAVKKKKKQNLELV